MLRNTKNHIALCLRSTFDRHNVVMKFEQNGFVLRVYERFADIMNAAEEMLLSGQSSLVIASVQNGGLALTEALHKQHGTSRVPVVLLDPEGDVRAAIRALQLGVAEYLVNGTQDDAVESQISRLHELLSEQTESDAASSAHSVAHTGTSAKTNHITEAVKVEVSFDASLRAIRKGDMWVSLSPIEWRLFEELLHNRGRVVTFGDLVKLGLNRTIVSAVETSLLRLHMSRLRAKLQQNFGRELNIITLRGRGYMLA
jgi:DNA-binding response OmpR family regulator